MINAISAADIAFIMSSSTSAWLLSRLECQKQNGWTLCFCFWGWIMWQMYNKTIIEFGFRMISWIIKTSCLCYLPQPSASANNTDLGFDNSWYHHKYSCSSASLTLAVKENKRRLQTLSIDNAWSNKKISGLLDVSYATTYIFRSERL